MNKEHKFLGIILDSRLAFIPHIKHLKERCLKTINILKILSHTNWGSDRKCLLYLYRSLIRSRLDYGSIVYQSATPNALKMLDPIHHLGIRLATGAFRTSPIPSLYVESNEWSLQLQRTYCSFTYFLKVYSNCEHPSYPVITDITQSTLFHNQPSVREPFSLRVRKLSDEMDIPLTTCHLMAPASLPPPWQWKLVECDMSFVEVTKHAPELHIQTHFLELQAKYSCPEFYTDASKSHAGMSYAAVGPSFRESDVLPPQTSIFTAEAYALLSAVRQIKKTKLQKAIIFTDSLSVVKSLISLRKQKNAVIIDLYLKPMHLTSK